MIASWYDVLDVDPSASDAEVRAAWRAAIADLVPTDRRFRAANQAAEVLLDPERRAAHDAELAAQEQEQQQADDTDPADHADDADDADDADPADMGDAGDAAGDDGAGEGTARRAGRTPPAWLIAGVAVLAAASVALASWLWTTRGETEESVEDSTRAAQAAAEAAIVPVLSYDWRDMDKAQAAGASYLTGSYRDEYDRLFEVLENSSGDVKPVVRAEVVASAVVRAGSDRVRVLLFVNRPTTKGGKKKVEVYKDQVTVTMQQVDGDWLIDSMVTTPLSG